MKVFAVIGARKNGQTDQLVGQFVNGALSVGHEVETEYLFAKKNVHGCIDCQTCRRNGGACVWKDDMTPLMEKVLAADVLVLASPVYFFSISSQLMLFMDRTYAVMETVSNKKVYFIATAAGPSADYAEDFRKVTEPIQGWLDCFEGMELVKTLSFFDTGTTDIKESETYQEAAAVGAAIRRSDFRPMKRYCTGIPCSFVF